MTPEELHERIKAHVTSMERPARSRLTHSDPNRMSTVCCYRNADGERCAIGSLIPDDAYTPGIEGSGVSMVEVAWGGWTPAMYAGAEGAANHLAEALDESGIPATRRHHRVMLRWQQRHDNPDYWDADGYVGPTCYPGAE